MPYDCGFAIVRDAAALQRAMSMSASYLPSGENRAPEAFSPEMSRRARGFAVWAVLMALGRQGVAEMVERHCAVARAIAARLAAEPGIAVLNEVVLNQVAVACGDGPEGDAATRAVLAEVQAEGTAYPSARALARAGDHADLGLGRAGDGRGRRADGRGGDRGLAPGAGAGVTAVIEAKGLGLTFETADGPVQR